MGNSIQQVTPSKAAKVWSIQQNQAGTLNAPTRGRRELGDVFLDAAYGTERSLDKPLGTITTVNKHSLVMGDKIRPLSILEQARGQSFSDNYQWPESKTLTMMMIGNAVPPVMAREITKAVLLAA